MYLKFHISVITQMSVDACGSSLAGKMFIPKDDKRLCTDCGDKMIEKKVCVHERS
jgi:hypothetical protein